MIKNHLIQILLKLTFYESEVFPSKSQSDVFSELSKLIIVPNETKEQVLDMLKNNVFLSIKDRNDIITHISQIELNNLEVFGSADDERWLLSIKEDALLEAEKIFDSSQTEGTRLKAMYNNRDKAQIAYYYGIAGYLLGYSRGLYYPYLQRASKSEPDALITLLALSDDVSDRKMFFTKLENTMAYNNDELNYIKHNYLTAKEEVV